MHARDVLYLCCLGLSALGAAFGSDRNFAQTFSTLFSSRVCRLFTTTHTLDELVHRQDHKEVHCGCKKEERNNGIDKVPNEEFTPVDSKDDARKVWSLK